WLEKLENFPGEGKILRVIAEKVLTVMQTTHNLVQQCCVERNPKLFGGSNDKSATHKLRQGGNDAATSRADEPEWTALPRGLQPGIQKHFAPRGWRQLHRQFC
ncbi:hypothetical protein ACT3TS_18495, partial [Specibacter sp. AOP5-B1-6]|uniref:hypothetical protein n=1 Tax=Specibacter sp. AOP5-B1-6 TaxID=3457653 RepID=UPI00402BCB7C